MALYLFIPQPKYKKKMQRIENLEIEKKRHFEEDGNVIHSRVIFREVFGMNWTEDTSWWVFAFWTRCLAL